MDNLRNEIDAKDFIVSKFNTISMCDFIIDQMQWPPWVCMNSFLFVHYYRLANVYHKHKNLCKT